MASCPRCHTALDEQQLDAFKFRLCRGCKGILGRHDDVMCVVDRSWRAVPEQQAEETPLRVKPETWQEPVFHCPDCQREMEKYGYMGMRAITIDRCDACSLIWLDADELQNMVLAMARDQYRAERALKNEHDGILDLAAGAVPPTDGNSGIWLFGRRWLSNALPVLALDLLECLTR